MSHINRGDQPLNGHDIDDFEQLTGAFDRPIAPSPTFADHLRQQAIREADMQNQLSTSVTHLTGHRAETIPKSSHSPASRPDADRGGFSISRRLTHISRPAWFGSLETAAAIVLVVLLAGSTFLYAGSSSVKFPGFTQNDDAPSVSFGMWGGGPEGTWYLSNQTPDFADAAPRILPGTCCDPWTYSAVISGDILVRNITRPVSDGESPTRSEGVSITAPDQEAVIEARALPSGDLLWEHELAMWGNLVADSDHVYAFVNSPEEAGPHRQLVAFDLDTGAQRWVSERQISFYDRAIQSPILVDEKIISAVDRDTYAAFSANTGDVVWEWSADSDAPGSTEVAGGWVMSSGAVVSDGETVFAVIDQTRLVALELESGAEQWRRDLPREARVNSAVPYLSIVDGKLLVTIAGSISVRIFDGEQETILDFAGKLQLLNPGDGTVIWSSDVPNASSAPVVIDLTIYVPTTRYSVSEEATAGVHFYAGITLIDFADGVAWSSTDFPELAAFAFGFSGISDRIFGQSSSRLWSLRGDNDLITWQADDIGSLFGGAYPPILWGDSLVSFSASGVVILDPSNPRTGTPEATPAT